MYQTEEIFLALKHVNALIFSARGLVWTAIGNGDVVSKTVSDEVVTFSESGTWQDPVGRTFRFSNIFEWSVVGIERIRLKHLRNGADNPVDLFDLSPVGDIWQSIRPHL